MDQNIIELNKRIAELEKKLDNFYRSSSIERAVETAFIERLGNTFPFAGDTSTANTQSISVPSTPVNITVPAQPSGSLAFTFRGTTYYLLYK